MRGVGRRQWDSEADREEEENNNKSLPVVITEQLGPPVLLVCGYEGLRRCGVRRRGADKDSWGQTGLTLCRSAGVRAAVANQSDIAAAAASAADRVCAGIRAPSAAGSAALVAALGIVLMDNGVFERGNAFGARTTKTLAHDDEGRGSGLIVQRRNQEGRRGK